MSATTKRAIVDSSRRPDRLERGEGVIGAIGARRRDAREGVWTFRRSESHQHPSAHAASIHRRRVLCFARMPGLVFRGRTRPRTHDTPYRLRTPLTAPTVPSGWRYTAQTTATTGSTRGPSTSPRRTADIRLEAARRRVAGRRGRTDALTGPYGPLGEHAAKATHPAQRPPHRRFRPRS